MVFLKSKAQSRKPHAEVGGSKKGRPPSPIRQSLHFVAPMTQALCIALASMSLLILTVVEADGEFSFSLAVRWVLLSIVLVAGNLWTRRVHQRVANPATALPFLVILPLLVVVWEGIQRSNGWGGRALEIVLMHFLAAMVFGLTLVCGWTRFHKACVAMSLFLATFGMTVSQQTTAVALVGVYTMIAIVWAATAYWEGLGTQVIQQATSPRRFLFPTFALILLGGIFAFTEQSKEILAPIRGLFPTSGGAGDHSEFARSGVGTGDMLVAGSKNIQSIGPIDDAPFMTDDKPSLYDVLDDMYNEPVTINKTDRAIALGLDEARRNQSKNNHVHHETQKANREFSTLRKPPPGLSKPIDDIRSNALFYVAGRTPLHLRLEHYDRFDGINWHVDPTEYVPAETCLKMVKDVSGRDWLKLPERLPTRTFFTEAETHAVKVVQLETNVIPSPSFLHGVHIDRVDRLDMYAYSELGMVRMAREKLAELVPIHLVSRTIDRWEFANSNPPFLGKYFSTPDPPPVPESIVEPIRQLALEWGGNEKHGWEQIQAVLQALRTKFAHDRNAVADPEAESPVLDFLFTSRRGPDYQFASSAALLLRTLGYTTRIVNGFYVSPASYDRRSRHTPVHKEDIHFWIEVRLDETHWIPFDPTPGYEILEPPFHWGKFTTRTFHALQATIRNNPFVIALTLSVVTLFWIFRARLWDRYAMVLWLCFPSRRCAVKAWQILKNRFRFGGLDVPKGVTPKQFFQWVEERSSSDAILCRRFVTMLNEETFSNARSQVSPSEETSAIMTMVLKQLTPSVCRRLASQWNQLQSHLRSPLENPPTISQPTLSLRK